VDFSAVLLLALCALVVGTLIGSVGIGGVLLPPMLVLLLDVSIHAAIAISMFSFMFTGALGTHRYSRHGSMRWETVGWLSIAAVPATYAGARVSVQSSPDALGVAVGALAAAAGVAALKHRKGQGREPLVPELFGLGVVVGFMSGLTGSGGPVTLVPLLLLRGVKPLSAIGSACWRTCRLTMTTSR
jgi:uncharacterized membrane protein YfcA